MFYRGVLSFYQQQSGCFTDVSFYNMHSGGIRAISVYQVVVICFQITILNWENHLSIYHSLSTLICFCFYYKMLVNVYNIDFIFFIYVYIFRLYSYKVPATLKWKRLIIRVRPSMWLVDDHLPHHVCTYLHIVYIIICSLLERLECMCGYDYVLATCEKVCVCVCVGVCALCEVIHDDLIKTRWKSVCT